MNTADVLIHMFELFAPALGLGLLAATLVKLFWRRAFGGVAWSRLAAGSAAGSAIALLGGLALFGRDGRMETYSAMVLASALGLGWTARSKVRA